MVNDCHCVSRSHRRGRGNYQEREETQIVLQLTDPGKLIGPGGSRVKEMEKTTRCRIQVDASGHRVLIVGTKQNAEEAKRQVEEIEAQVRD